MSLRPLIAICGTTGVGKSKLAIELALALAQNEPHARHGGYSGARIINADAMQVYAGIDILTNKVPAGEQCGVEHLLMGFKHPGEQYVVGEWVKDAVRLIDETHERKQVPIVVGGTSYWIQHLLFPGRLAALDQPLDAPPSATASAPSLRLTEALEHLAPDLQPLYHNLAAQPAAEAIDPDTALALHRLLAALDPPVAQRWHWRDTRKVLRSLELIAQTGRLPSEIIAEQSQNAAPPRYRALCFWLWARPEVLNARLDARVDQMLEQGLLREVEELMTASYSASESPATAEETTRAGGQTPSTDYTLGVYQSIGYREFSSYLALDRSIPVPEREKAYHAAVERMKTSTRQYAKRQVSWIRNKLLPAARAANALPHADGGGGGGDDVVATFLLDASELGDSWTADVQETATRLTADFLAARALPDSCTLSAAAAQLLAVREKPTTPSAVLAARRKVVCRVCTVDERAPVMLEEGGEWAAHERSRRHRGMAARLKRLREGHGGGAAPGAAETQSEA